MVRRALLVLAAAAGACSGRAGEFDGIGDWRFPHTTLQDIHAGVCQPTELGDRRKATWCYAQPPIKLAGRAADVDLYFLGTEETAHLIEIQLVIRGCQEDQLDQWLRTSFGAPIQTRPGRGFWKNSFLWIAALMPSEPGRCLVHVLPLSETAEIARLQQP
jgi:hypothetical protein